MGWVRDVSGLFCLTVVLFAGQAAAQTSYANYPNRPIKIISGSPAGGGVDLSTRIVADQLQKLWGQPVTVEDRTGSSSNIAGEAVARSEPDGYTLFATPPSTITANAVLFRHLNYDPAALEPVAIMAVAPNVLAVRNNLPVKTVAELIAYAKSKASVRPRISLWSCSRAERASSLFTSRTGERSQQ